MENLNVEEIKCGLKHCTAKSYKCEECPYFYKSKGIKSCMEILMTDALALTISQEQDKEKLGLLIDELEKEKQELWEERNRIYNDLQDWKAIAEENERLRAKIVEEDRLLNDRVIESVNAVSKAHQRYTDALEEKLKTVKADTVRKMQKGLKSKSEVVYGDRAVCVEWIDQIAKEILEENKK